MASPRGCDRVHHEKTAQAAESAKGGARKCAGAGTQRPPWRRGRFDAGQVLKHDPAGGTQAFAMISSNVMLFSVVFACENTKSATLFSITIDSTSDRRCGSP